MNKFHFAMVSAMTVVLGACAHHPRPTDTHPGDKMSSQAPASDASASASAADKSRACQSDLDCGDGSLCLDKRCVPTTSDSAACREAKVHFDRDDITLHADDYPILQRLARCLKADHAMTAHIDGNADERGTTEYNLALGDRRARTVAGYLKMLGVTEGQLATVSYGKEKPLCEEHDEGCWRVNRRAGLNLGR